MKTPFLILFLLLAKHGFSQTPYQNGSGKWGYKDPAGNLIVQPIYDYAGQFYPTSDGLAVVNTGGVKVNFGYQGGRWAYVDKNGKEIIILPSEFVNAQRFITGKAVVQLQGGKLLYIDRAGRMITETARQEDGNGYFQGELAASPEGSTAKYGMRHGSGTYTWKNGERFEGSWRFGKGTGKCYRAGGLVEEGTLSGTAFSRGTGNGQAPAAVKARSAGDPYLSLPSATTVNYSSGKYEGQLVDGRAAGTGRFTYTNGAVYEGKWRQGLPQGAGTMRLADEGMVYDGSFDKGYFTGGRILVKAGRLNDKNVIIHAGKRVFVAGRTTKNVQGRELQYVNLSNGASLHPETEVELFAETNDEFRIYGGMSKRVEKVREGRTIENTSSYGYYDPKKGANVVVSRKTETYVPGSYKTVGVPCAGCDQSGYKWVTELPVDNTKRARRILPHGLVEHHLAEKIAGGEAPPAADGKGKLLFAKSFTGSEHLWEYSGEIKNGMANGYGEAFTDRGLRYKGQWKDNQFEGTGTCNWGNGGVYSGDWKNGKQHGKGTYTDIDRQHYEYGGDWVNGQRHGHGKVYQKGTIAYDGQWVADQREGIGYGTIETKVVWNNTTAFRDAHYLGSWKNGKANGSGRLLRQEKIGGGPNTKNYQVEEGEFESGRLKKGTSRRISSAEFADLLAIMKKEGPQPSN